MINYWPEGLELTDTQSPLDILKSAQTEWLHSSDGVMTLVLQMAESQTGNPMIIVHAKHVPSNRTATLFSVVHRPSASYPVTIQPRDVELPNFLKKSYTSSSAIQSMRELADSANPRTENKWVSDTPAEFRDKLAEVMNLGAVKAEVLNLLTEPDASEQGNGHNSGEDDAATS